MCDAIGSDNDFSQPLHGKSEKKNCKRDETRLFEVKVKLMPKYLVSGWRMNKFDQKTYVGVARDKVFDKRHKLLKLNKIKVEKKMKNELFLVFMKKKYNFCLLIFN